MSVLIDSHSHIQDARFDEDIADVVERAHDAGIEAIIVCGDDQAMNERALALSSRFDGLYPTVGYHPHEARNVTPGQLAVVAAQAELAEVVAVGEIGLDYFRDMSPRDVQRRVLDDQLEIAVRVGKPVCVHSRGAEDEIAPQLEAYAAASPLTAVGRSPGVMHCFGGTLEQAQRYVAMGFMVSLATAITYPKNDEARRVAAGLPLESLLVETDSPYLPPQRMRGTRNEPAHVVSAAASIAEARGVSLDVVAEATTQNARRLFGIAVGGGVAA